MEMNIHHIKKVVVERSYQVKGETHVTKFSIIDNSGGEPIYIYTYGKEKLEIEVGKKVRKY